MRLFPQAYLGLLLLFMMSSFGPVKAQERDSILVSLDFNDADKSYFDGTVSGHKFVKGIEGKALKLNPNEVNGNLSIANVALDGRSDFTVQCWFKTTSKTPQLLLSQKKFGNKGINAQKNAGWALYSSGGTFALSLGSGDRRINYERDNGERMPLNDGKWHQLTLSYNTKAHEFRLYYDGHNKAVYKVGFEFSNNNPLTIGSEGNQFDYDTDYLDEIVLGKEHLQSFVDAFNSIGLEPLKNEEFIDFISHTERLFEQKAKTAQEGTYSKGDLDKALTIREKLLPNPYTVYQIRDLTLLKPVSKIFELAEGRVIINETVARGFTKSEKLHPSDFTMDELNIWNKTLSAADIQDNYNKQGETSSFPLTNNLKNLNVGVWNIWNGGIHWSLEKDGWDSRLRIVEMIKDNKLDIILMQETYSAGDFIAAELGYYYGTTSDLDYRYQGSNISVLSRYPIKDIEVLEETGYNNVAVKLVISKTQEIWAMSNWYGMPQFTTVFEFHRSRFENSNKIPVLFGGDFNAVTHTDGGNSPASKKMQDNGFMDAYRSLYPNVEMYPGITHRNGKRIDQLYFKGKGLTNIATEVISTLPSGFPSDHYLIVTKFELDY